MFVSAIIPFLQSTICQYTLSKKATGFQTAVAACPHPSFFKNAFVGDFHHLWSQKLRVSCVSVCVVYHTASADTCISARIGGEGR